MRVIFLRHGQTGENAAHRHQPTNTPLSVLGRTQAVAAGKLLRSEAVTHIVSSPVVRALQTASLVTDQLDLLPSIDYNLRELERPDALVGHRHFSLRSLLFYTFWFLGLTQGGEAYRDLRARIAAARTELERLPADATVVVVSHTVFINLYIAHVHRSWSVWPWQAALVFWRLVRMKNTARVEFEVIDGCWRWSKLK